MSRIEDTNDREIDWVCPRCRGRLSAEAGGLTCRTDDLHFPLKDGIWRFLLPEREAYFAPFIEQYGMVRRDEGWGLDTGAYYRALPFEDLSGKHNDIWRIRSKSFEALLTDVIYPLGGIDPLSDGGGRPLQVLDLGAGNGWLAYQLARRGHQVMALDLLTDVTDGLGAHIHYDADFVPVQAEFNRLPVDADQVDVVVYNGALHYSTDYQETLLEGLRVLRPNGRLVVMDSPVYRDAASGKSMVQERQERFASRYDFSEQPLPSENYLTFDRLEELSGMLGLHWAYLKPDYGLLWGSRTWWARLRRIREPATFLVVAGRRV